MSYLLKDKASRQFYQHYNQAKDVIQGIEPIDYFFAKEMLNALVFERFSDESQFDISSELLSEQSYLNLSAIDGIATRSAIVIANLSHLFLALNTSLRAGHSCLPLNEVAGKVWGKGYPRKKSHASHKKSVAGSVLVAASLEDNQSEENESELSHIGFTFESLPALQVMLSTLEVVASDNQLLVFSDNNLYLRRYYKFETDLGHYINSRLAQQSQFDNNAITQCISTLFPQESSDISADITPIVGCHEIDWQKIAVANSINKNFSVIAGGPGTGKTYTVTKLLAALVMLQQSANQINNQNDKTLNIALVAPTGKAAQRLSESIVDAITGFKGLIPDEVLANIPTQAQTIHRLLGVIPNSPNFKHNEDNILTADVVLIDEVSMVDLPLMTRVFRALKHNAKVILLGDADQLPSVAAGSVLADIAPRPHSGFSKENREYLNIVCQLSSNDLIDAFSQENNNESFDYLTFLVKSRRFDGQGGIGLLAKSVIEGDRYTSWQLLTQSISESTKEADTPCAVNELTLAQGELDTWLAPLIKAYYRPLEFAETVQDGFNLLSKFRVLCATRQGEYGVEQLNELIKSYLGKHNAPHMQRQGNQQKLYHGLPIMINENDYRLGLYNGDVGIVWRVIDKTGTSHFMVCFEDTAIVGGIRQILPSRLPSFESVYAMTIHKTQGSEFSHVAMVISATESTQQPMSKLLSRELLYTGITRAKKQLTVAVNQRIWQQGVTAKVQRHSGLNVGLNLGTKC